MYGDVLPNKLELNKEVKSEFAINSENNISLVLYQGGEMKIQINLTDEEVIDLYEDLRWGMNKVGIL
jgi:hypothetical protein